MRNTILPFLLCLLIASCGSGDSGKAGDETTAKESNSSASSAEGVISFKADGEAVTTTGWHVQRFVWDENTTKPWMNITSNMHADKRTINVNLNGATAGTYSFSENSSVMTDSHGTYFPDFMSPLANYLFVSGEIQLTEVDTVKGIINGSFSVTAKDGNGNTLMITDGRLINVKLKPGVSNLSQEAEKLTQ